MATMTKAECRDRAKELAFRILPANASVLDLNYAIAQLTPLYEMIAEGNYEPDPMPLRLIIKGPYAAKSTKDTPTP